MRPEICITPQAMCLLLSPEDVLCTLRISLNSTTTPKNREHQNGKRDPQTKAQDLSRSARKTKAETVVGFALAPVGWSGVES